MGSMFWSFSVRQILIVFVRAKSLFVSRWRLSTGFVAIRVLAVCDGEMCTSGPSWRDLVPGQAFDLCPTLAGVRGCSTRAGGVAVFVDDRDGCVECNV